MIIEYRSLKCFDQELFLSDLKEVPWGTAFIYDNEDDVWAHWSTLYKNILDQHTPNKNKWLRGDQLPWISPEIQREISLRNRMFRRHRRHPSIGTWEAYKRQRNKVTSLKRKGFMSYCNKVPRGILAKIETSPPTFTVKHTK